MCWAYAVSVMDWLLWYNTERPHWTLKFKSPMRALLDGLRLLVVEPNMVWTDTQACRKLLLYVQ